MILFGFGLYLALILLIGFSAIYRKKNNSEDYLLAGRDIKPWMASLSAVATNCSGYMFVGLVGYTYTFGVSAFWIPIGWIVGDFIASISVLTKFRIQSEKANSLSFASAISSWHSENRRFLRIIIALISIFFLGTYAAAQISASGKALQTLLGLEYNLGALFCTCIIIIYCVFGGLRASIWTDSIQAIIMIFSMLLMVFFSYLEIGTFANFVSKLQEVSTSYTDFWTISSNTTITSPFLFALGWCVSGFGVIGQPHIMIRFMSLDSPASFGKARIYYYLGFSTIFFLSIVSGLLARVILQDSGSFDHEIGLLILAQKLLPDFLIGIFLAGLFAASMSTADSQILSCAAACVYDLGIFAKKHEYFYIKLMTFLCSILALLIALYAKQTVFFLVIMSWTVLASSFAPLIILYVLNFKISERLSILISLGGFLGSIVSHLVQNQINDIIIGFVCAFGIFALYYAKNKKG